MFGENFEIRKHQMAKNTLKTFKDLAEKDTIFKDFQGAMNPVTLCILLHINQKYYFLFFFNNFSFDFFSSSISASNFLFRSTPISIFAVAL